MIRVPDLQFDQVMDALKRIDESNGVFGNPVQDGVNRMCEGLLAAVQNIDDSLNTLSGVINHLHAIESRVSSDLNQVLSEDQKDVVRVFRNHVLKSLSIIEGIQRMKDKLRESTAALPDLHERIQRLF